VDASVEPMLRRSEWVLVLYFTYTALLTIHFSLSFFHRAAAVTIPTLLMLLAYVDSFQPRFATSVVRDWLPAPLILLAYWQLDWFAQPAYLRELERWWLGLDRTILYQYGVQAGVELFGPVIPTILEIAYILVYAIPPLSIAALYLCHRRKQVDAFLFPFLLGVLLCYAQFPFWPSEPPRAVFPGQDMPTFQTPIRVFSLWIVGNYGIHTSVFPSAHVSGAVAAALGMAHLVPRRRLLVSAYFAYAALVAIATIYGRYHYAVDAIAGTAVGCIALPLGTWLSSQGERHS